MAARERLQKEAAAVLNARQDRELGRGVGRVANEYTKLLTRTRPSRGAVGVLDVAARGETASSLLDCYLKTQGMAS